MQTYSSKTLKTSKKLLVECNELTMKYDNLVALKDISLTVNEGDFLYIIGPNGAGKSTLIKLLTKTMFPTSGEVKIHTKDIGYLPQLNATKKNFPITVSEVIYSGFKKQRLIMSKRDKEIINYWLNKMNVPGIANELISNLSGGQQQRILLIRSLVSNPKLLVLDEPTSALDPIFRSSFNTILKELSEDGITIIFITHDLKELYENSRIIYLNQTLEFSGSYKDYQNWKR